MSEHRTAVARVVGPSTARRRRWLVGAVAVLGAGGLILGGPVSADDLNAIGNVYASADVQEDCVTAAVGTGGSEGAQPQQGSEPSQFQVDGEGTATVSVCREDLGETPPVDPGGSVPGDPGGVVPDDLDDVVPDDLDDVVPGDPGGSLAGELIGAASGVLEDLEDAVPGDGDGSLPPDPDGGVPGVDDVVPGGLGGLVPDGLGLDPGLLDRLAQILPPAVDDGGPGGNHGGRPAINTSANGTASGSAAVGGAGAERGAPTESVLGAEAQPSATVSVGPAVSPGATLPRTGGGLGSGVLRLIAFLGLGRALLGVANRRRPAAGEPNAISAL